MRLLFFLMLSLPAAVFAKAAPLGMTQFNKSCPAPAECEKLREAQNQCRSKAGEVHEACHEFIQIYRRLLPEYDCERPEDYNPQQPQVVPALWLCQNFEEATQWLSQMKSKGARRLFGSENFRRILDGDMAEAYLAKSKQVEQTLKKNRHHGKKKADARPPSTKNH